MWICNRKREKYDSLSFPSLRTGTYFTVSFSALRSPSSDELP